MYISFVLSKVILSLLGNKAIEIMTITKNNKSIVIVRTVKANTKRVFFYPTTKEGLRLNRTNFARQYDAISLGNIYLNQ